MSSFTNSCETDAELSIEPYHLWLQRQEPRPLDILHPWELWADYISAYVKPLATLKLQLRQAKGSPAKILQKKRNSVNAYYKFHNKHIPQLPGYSPPKTSFEHHALEALQELEEFPERNEHAFAAVAALPLGIDYYILLLIETLKAAISIPESHAFWADTDKIPADDLKTILNERVYSFNQTQHSEPDAPPVSNQESFEQCTNSTLKDEFLSVLADFNKVVGVCEPPPIPCTQDFTCYIDVATYLKTDIRFLEFSNFAHLPTYQVPKVMEFLKDLVAEYSITILLHNLLGD